MKTDTLRRAKKALHQEQEKSKLVHDVDIVAAIAKDLFDNKLEGKLDIYTIADTYLKKSKQADLVGKTNEETDREIFSWVLSEIADLFTERAKDVRVNGW